MKRLIVGFVVAIVLAGGAMTVTAEAFYIDCSWAWCWPFNQD